MKTYRIAVLPGDGIGPEIVLEAVKVLGVVAERAGVHFEMEEGFVGGAAYDRFGTPLPEEVMELALASDAVLLGAVGGPKWGPPRLQRPAGAGSPRPAIRSRPLREPPSGRRL